MKHRRLIIAFCLVIVATMVCGLPAQPPRTSDQAKDTGDPSDTFFDALLRHPERRHESRRALHEAVLKPGGSPRHVLLLGLNELWLSAESQPDVLVGFNHAVLARHWLRRAEVLLPEDTRIPSWRWAAEWSIATAEHREADAAAARDMLRKLAEQNPCSHSVALGIISFDRPADSGEFREAHAAMEAAFRCGSENPAVQDRPHWPHNVHAFLTALADFRLKAGIVRDAEAALVIAEARPGFERWIHRGMVTDRLTSLNVRRDLFTNADPTDDPSFVFERGGPTSCIGCHGE
jgi:PAS domain-containing protein